MNNLFSIASNGRLTVPLLPQCGLCGLYKNCNSPKMPVSGRGRKEILILGEAPGQNEDKEGRQFIGKSGQFLRGIFSEYGIDPDEDCWFDNSLMCHPKDSEGNNRTPNDKEIMWCRPHVVQTIKDLKPRVIVCFGGVAVKSLIGWLWKPKVGEVGRWVGWQIPDQQINAWICPTWHPAWIQRTDYGKSGKPNPVRELLFRQHIKAAIELEGRPWLGLPNYENVQMRFDPTDFGEIGNLITPRPIAFDFETNMIKPDSKEAEIVCCSISNGSKTIAFPWTGAFIRATKELLESDTPKIGFNVKFEHRWCKKFDCTVNNWIHDGMTTAHVLDNRYGISGLEFQSYVLLGQRPWDHEVAPHMEGGPNKPNRLREMDLRKLLLYCGMDSLLEWHVAQKQMRLLDERITKHRTTHRALQSV